MEPITLPLVYLYEHAVVGECIQTLDMLGEGFRTKFPIVSGGGPIADGRYVLILLPLLPGVGDEDTRVYFSYFDLCIDTFIK